MESIDQLPEGHKVAEEVAIEDLRQFLKLRKRKSMDAEELLETYPDIVEAIQLGLLTLPEDGAPTYILRDPIKGDSGEISTSQIIFKTRITPSEQRKVANGVDLKKDQLLFAHKCLAFVVGQPLAMLDKFEEGDYKVIDQLATVFI
jgi:hypothetical protein